MRDRRRERIWTATALAATALASTYLVTAACGGGAGPGKTEPGWPSWVEELPARAPQAAVGEVVWAVIPEQGSEDASLGTYRLEAAEGTTAVLSDNLGNRFGGVPGALVLALAAWPAGEPRPGDAALAHRWDAGPVVGRVELAEAGGTLLAYTLLAYDWNGVTTRGAMDAVAPLATGEARPLPRWVAFHDASGSWLKGLGFAEDGDRLWLRDDSGHARIVARDDVRALSDLGQSDLAAGSRVAAYSWGHGYRPGTVARELEPGLRYDVELASGETRAFYFADLTTVELPGAEDGP